MGGRCHGGDSRVPQEAEPVQHSLPREERRQRELGREEETGSERRTLIFVDSSWIIALADEDDENHRRAESLPNLEADQMISDLVLSESVTWVGAHLGYKSAREVFDNLYRNPAVKVVFVNKRLAERSFQTYAKYGGKALLRGRGLCAHHAGQQGEKDRFLRL